MKEMLLLAAALMILAPLPGAAQGIELPRLTWPAPAPSPAPVPQSAGRP
ncbi:hypothetical protein CSE45_3611 [Citreicella sp. SE45]|nr:hypothetical protein CSE45_3611 [Citreicella sp. SE45]